MYYLGLVPTFRERFGLSVDLAVTGTAIFETGGGIIMLASFIREKHINQGKKEKEIEIQKQIRELKAQGLSDTEILERLTLASSQDLCECCRERATSPGKEALATKPGLLFFSLVQVKRYHG